MTTPTSGVVGWIGLGNIGGPMAQRLLQAGIRVLGTDLDAEALAAFTNAGGEAANSAREIADQVETVFLSVPNGAVARTVTLGDDGLTQGSRLRRVVDLSTIGASAAESLDRDVATAGRAWIDAPVSGGVAGAVKGTLSVMASGTPTAVEEVAPYLEHFGTVYRVGDRAGQGQVMKLVNNYLSAAALATTSEALVAGVRAGLAPTSMLEVLNASSGRNSATLDKFPRAIVPRLFDLGFSTGLMAKDVGLFTEHARQLGVPLWVGSSIQQIWDHTTHQNGPHADFSSIVQPYERWAGVEVAAQPSTTDTDTDTDTD